MTRPKLRVCDDNEAYMNRQDDILSGTKPGGSDGGGTMDNLEKRVTSLEADVMVIRTELTTLTVRSENFSTKSDLVDLKSALHTELRNQTWAFCGLLVAAIAAVAGIVALMR